jgi:hypothetical protein
MFGDRCGHLVPGVAWGVVRSSTLACSCCGDRHVWAEVPSNGPRYLEGKRCLVAACPACAGPCRGSYRPA